jgi:DNA modification methylase
VTYRAREQSPFFADDSVELWHGDCLDVMASLPDASIDAVVTDPPYGLEFMGKEWDAPWRTTGDVVTDPADVGGFQDGNGGNPYSRSRIRFGIGAGFQQWCEQWATECLRVLKPGGHLLAFGGTRTWHRLACAVEDAGFELRDSIAWLYGSGFPKSLDVSKAIDKANGRKFEDRYALGRHIKEQREAAGLTRADVNAWFGYRDGCEHWERQDPAGARVPTLADWQVLRDRLGLSDEHLLLIEREEAERAVVGASAWTNSAKHFVPGEDHTQRLQLNITAPATPAARQWQGWGTALKPAFEPIVVARKPLAGTVAGNVLAWGTGAINVDGCRVESSTPVQKGAGSYGFADDRTHGYVLGAGREYQSAGRWPTNVVLDGDAADELDRQSGTSVSRASAGRNGRDEAEATWGLRRTADEVRGHDDSGGSSRFFPVFRYEAKAPTAERPRVKAEGGGNGRQNYGGYKVKACDECGRRWPSNEPQPCGHDAWTWQEPLDREPDTVAHPTVKPLALMRWLVRLVTPPGGTVLEPFAGSGTTAEACVIEGFRCIAIEREAAYLPLIVARLTKPIQPDLFGGAA